MAPIFCNRCSNKAFIKHSKTGAPLCRDCFEWVFEEEVHHTITRLGLFSRGERIAIGASGGKDSTVLAHVLHTLNRRHSYGLQLELLSIDEGIAGYRDDSLRAVEKMAAGPESEGGLENTMPLAILSYKELYGWSMDEVVAQIGLRNNCTFCGVFRRQALDRGAVKLGVDKVATGHNADDVAETVLMNLLRGDLSRLLRCTEQVTGESLSTSSSFNSASNSHECSNSGGGDAVLKLIPRVKPLLFSYEKDIVMYARSKRLEYFCTECIYAPNAYRGHVRTLIKDLERVRPSLILDILHSGQSLAAASANPSTDLGRNQSEEQQIGDVTTEKNSSIAPCVQCGHMASATNHSKAAGGAASSNVQLLCKTCQLLNGLNSGRPRLAIGKHSSKLLPPINEPENKAKSKEQANNSTVCECKNQTNCSSTLSKSITLIE